MPRFRRYGRRGFRGRSRNRPRWIAQSDTLVAATNAVDSSLLVRGTSVALSGSVEGELVVQRMVGVMHVNQLSDPGAIQVCGLGIIQTDADNAFLPVLGAYGDPLVGDQLGIRNWLWTGSVVFPDNAFTNARDTVIHIDTRVKRRLESSDGIFVFLTNPAGQVASVQVDVDIRILITVRI